MSKGRGIIGGLGEGLGFGAVGLFGSTTRNTCTAEDKGFFCQTSRITGLIGSILSLLHILVYSLWHHLPSIICGCLNLTLLYIFLTILIILDIVIC